MSPTNREETRHAGAERKSRVVARRHANRLQQLERRPVLFLQQFRDRRVAAGGGTPKILTSKFDEDPRLLEWAPEGIYFEAEQRTYNHLFRLDPQTQAITRVTSPDKIAASAFSFTHDYATIACMKAADNEFSEVYVSPVRFFRAEKTHRHLRAVREFSAGHSRSDRVEIQRRHAHRRHPDEARGFRSLEKISVAGRDSRRPHRHQPRHAFADRYYPIELFAANGAVILEPNYRGSAGYGEKFRALNVRNLGVGDYDDVISGVDSLIAQGFVDKDRVGAMGWSEGGYISAFITTYSDRFRAVSVGAGISDWMTYYVNTDITPFTRQYLNATPWDDPEIYRKTSPITYINHAHTPTLIQQGSKDARVPVPDSFELYRGLKDRGVPVKLVLYKGFGHPINKPKQQRAVTQEN